jgi:hypothetical protein
MHLSISLTVVCAYSPSWSPQVGNERLRRRPREAPESVLLRGRVQRVVRRQSFGLCPSSRLYWMRSPQLESPT